MNNHFRQGIKNIPEICAQYGVQRAIIAPGSRNAPLILAFTAQSNIECLSITDERSAAYFAVGMVQAEKNPVALICTSGTAVLNFAPAIAEAYYQGLPLIIFTADRPAELTDQADGQTIKQTNIFANYVKASLNIPVETEKNEDLQFLNRQVAQAIDMAKTFPCAPVHINVPLREPLYAALPKTHSNPKVIKTLTSTNNLTSESITALKNGWLLHKRKMVVFGAFPQKSDFNHLAKQLAKEPDTVVIAENLSNISGENIITQPELLFAKINSFKTEKFNPDLLITIGNSIICKQLKSFLRTNKPVEHWQFETIMPYIDTYNNLTTIIPALACEVLSAMPKANEKSDFAEKYAMETEIISAAHENFVNNSAELSDMCVVSNLLKTLPKDSVLQLASSTSVRWTQLFPTRADLTYFCNRGVSGIDGSLSTAAGYAYLSQKHTFFLTGDLSFIYDSNAFWNNYIGDNFKIIVMNNNGGNIFRNIANKETIANCEHFFTTPHNVKIKHLTAAYGVDYICCEKYDDLENKIAELINTNKCTVLEVFTGAEINTRNYFDCFEKIKES
jgi:2-succinyl-5-enolpyruvyl-6-hydroxy-3-cyclohexene-1-carboxylic-acid synthase